MSRARFLASVVILLGVVATGTAGCSERQAETPSVQRGRQVYTANCTSCHNQNPALPGALGPEVKGAPREVLEAKIVQGRYPPDYKPKRSTAVMPPQPALAPDIPALADFLKP